MPVFILNGFARSFRVLYSSYIPHSSLHFYPGPSPLWLRALKTPFIFSYYHLVSFGLTMEVLYKYLSFLKILLYVSHTHPHTHDHLPSCFFSHFSMIRSTTLQRGDKCLHLLLLCPLCVTPPQQHHHLVYGDFRVEKVMLGSIWGNEKEMVRGVHGSSCRLNKGGSVI